MNNNSIYILKGVEAPNLTDFMLNIKYSNLTLEGKKWYLYKLLNIDLNNLLSYECITYDDGYEDVFVLENIVIDIKYYHDGITTINVEYYDGEGKCNKKSTMSLYYKKEYQYVLGYSDFDGNVLYINKTLSGKIERMSEDTLPKWHPCYRSDNRG